jgi:hypothetical protein
MKSTTDAISTLLDQVTAGLRVLDASASKAEVADSRPGRIKKLEEKRKDIKKLTSLYGKIEPAKAFDESALKTLAQVSLYLPKAIQINDGVEYDTGFQLGMIGGVAEQAMNDGGTVLGSLAGAFLDTGINTAKAVMGGSGMAPGSADILAQKVAGQFGGIGTAVAGGMRAASGITTNPNTRAMFKDVPLRNFSFGFSMIPTSQSEARVIENIVKLFRTELYPTTLTAGGIRIGYEFPNQFLIKVKHRGNDVNLKFLPVYLQSFNATYNANSPLMHADGKFNSVDIAMTFTETRALTKADVARGGY